MKEYYDTIQKTGQSLVIEKKSRFIGIAVPVSSEEEALAVIEDEKRRYRDARHHCSAFCAGIERPLERANDDGEPSGTAGKTDSRSDYRQSASEYCHRCNPVFWRYTARNRGTREGIYEGCPGSRGGRRDRDHGSWAQVQDRV